MHKANVLQIKQWNNIHGSLILVASLLSLYAGQIFWIIGAASFSFIYYIASHFIFLQQYRPFGGWANGITFLRLCILLISASIFHLFESLHLFIIFGSIITLDYFDGFIARKKNLQSDFGLYFDMETDALFVLLASFVLYLEGLAPWWVLIPGLLRYINVFVYFIFRLPPKKEPKRKYASYIAGFLFFALLLPFILPQKLSIPILGLASVLVTLSFIVSFIQYLQAEPIEKNHSKG